MDMTKPIANSRVVKIGIVGCGGIARDKHLPALSVIPGVEIVAFCDLIEERAVEAAKKYGTTDAKIFVDYKDLLKIDDIEVVHVLTPNYAHAFITIDALDAKKHVMCEKPMAMNGKEARDMCEAAKRNDRLLTVGYNSRSQANSQYLHNLVEEGVLGEIYFCNCPAIRRRGVPGWGVFTDKEKQGGGPLIDIATHSIDVCLYIMNNYEVESVMGTQYLKLAKDSYECNEMGLYDPNIITTEDSAFAMVRFKNGATMLVQTSWCLNVEESATPKTLFCGTKAGAELSDTVNINGDFNGSLYSQKIKTNPRMRTHFKDEDLAWNVYEAKQWINAVVNGTPVLTKPEQAAVVSEIIEAIYKSSKTKKAVYFD